MDAFDKEVIRVAVGCLIALAFWKHSRESLRLAIGGIVVLAATMKYAGESEFPVNCLIYGSGFVVLSIGKSLFANPKPWKERMATFNRGFKEFLGSRTVPPGKP